MSTVTGPTSGSVLERLRQAAGAEAVLDVADAGRWAVAGVDPLAVVMPDTAQAAAAVLALCSRNGWPVEPAGSGTWLRAGARPARPPVVVSTARLRTIHEYEPADLVVGVHAGMPLAELQTVLAGHRQALPLDPPAAAAATLGAITALADAGPLRALHGTPSDCVRGVEIVTGDGRVLRFGGRVVKNVAGYDLVRLLIGSRGAFGLVTSLYLRLRGAAPRDATWSTSARDAAMAAHIATTVRGRLEADALEVLGPGLGAAAGLTARGGAPWTVLVRSRGGEEAVQDAGYRLEHLAEGFGLVDPEADLAAWRALGEDEAGAVFHVMLKGPANRLPEALALSGIVASSNYLRLAAHAADGIVRLWGTDDRVDAAGVLRTLRDRAATIAWTATCTLCPERARGAVAGVPEPPAAQFHLQRELKARFDPAGVLSPGRHLRGM